MVKIKLNSAVSVDKGCIRQVNEDNIYFNGFILDDSNRDEGIHIVDESRDECMVYAVFDGMGGASYGEEASRIAAETLGELLEEHRISNETDADEFVSIFANVSNEKICDRAKALDVGRIGATMAVVVIYGCKAKVYNIGDSRIYLQREGALFQLTTDDTFAKRLHLLGVISEEEASVHRDRNVLVQHLGMPENELPLEIHKSQEFEVTPGDKLLICSDGLTDMLHDDRITDILSSENDISHMCEELVCEALDVGGEDNISVILLEAVNTVAGKPSFPRFSEVGRISAFLVALISAIIIGSFLIFALLWNNYPSRYADMPEADISSSEPVAETLTKEVISYEDYIVVSPGTEVDLAVIADKLKFHSTCTYTSGDTSVATVSEKGVLSGVVVGETTVTLEDSDKICLLSISVVERGSSAGKVPLKERFINIAEKLLKGQQKSGQ